MRYATDQHKITSSVKEENYKLKSFNIEAHFKVNAKARWLTKLLNAKEERENKLVISWGALSEVMLQKTTRKTFNCKSVSFLNFNLCNYNLFIETNSRERLLNLSMKDWRRVGKDVVGRKFFGRIATTKPLGEIFSCFTCFSMREELWIR